MTVIVKENIIGSQKRGPVVFLSGAQADIDFMRNKIFQYRHLMNIYILLRNSLVKQVQELQSENNKESICDCLVYFSHELVIRSLFQQENREANQKRQSTMQQNKIAKIMARPDLSGEEKEEEINFLKTPQSRESMLAETIAAIEVSTKTESAKAKAIAKARRKYLQGKVTARERGDLLKQVLGGHQLFQDFLNIGQELKAHVIRNLIKSINIAYENAQKKFLETKIYHPPRAEKLDRVQDFFLDLCELSSRQKGNSLGINIDKSMRYFFLSKDIARHIPELKSAKVTKVGILKGQLAVVLCYPKPLPKPNKQLPIKYAGLDLGLKNIGAIFLDDDNTPSLLLRAQHLLQLNAKFNEANSDFNEQLTLMNQELARRRKKDSAYILHSTMLDRDSNYLALARQRDFIRQKQNSGLLNRRNFLHDFFHKLSVRILEFLAQARVTDLAISRNMGEMKNSGTLKSSKKHKRRFIGLPILKLLDDIELNSIYYNITCHKINEAYSSKTNCLTGDVREVQKQFPISRKKTPLEGEEKSSKSVTRADYGTTFDGRRKKGAFIHANSKAYHHADINGAANHICLAGQQIRWNKQKKSKLHQPLLIKLNTTVAIIKNKHGVCRKMMRNVLDKTHGLGLFVSIRCEKFEYLPLALGKA